jgi:hypothetical protein
LLGSCERAPAFRFALDLASSIKTAVAHNEHTNGKNAEIAPSPPFPNNAITPQPSQNKLKKSSPRKIAREFIFCRGVARVRLIACFQRSNAHALKKRQYATEQRAIARSTSKITKSVAFVRSIRRGLFFISARQEEVTMRPYRVSTKPLPLRSTNPKLLPALSFGAHRTAQRCRNQQYPAQCTHATPPTRCPGSQLLSHDVPLPHIPA